MLIEEKYFPQDKNYLLKSVQAFSKVALIDQWLDKLWKAYSLQHNPMGLVDDFILNLEHQIKNSRSLLEDNYDLLAAIYRYNHSDNQLAIMWDGRSHMEVYDAEWKTKYSQWIATLSEIEGVQRPAIKMAVTSSDMDHTFLQRSVRKSIMSHFRINYRKKSLLQKSA